MTEDGKFGFGHLRYQEYLVAQELLLNRGIDLISLLADPWWRGAFVLFAQMNENVHWLIEEAVQRWFLKETGNITQLNRARETIMQ